jgi:glyoxylase-like metal-dependent hydrolase (beta-lactamase superfamily II)
MYKIYALKTGSCNVRADVAFHGGSTDKVYPFFLYIWLIEGAEKPILVDTGPRDIEGFNRATAEYIPGGIVQNPGEDTVSLLKSKGLLPEDIGYVILTHFHPDHCSNLYLFPQAQILFTKKVFCEHFPDKLPVEVVEHIKRNWERSTRLVDDNEEVLPGLKLFWVGGHSPCSQAILVATKLGNVVLTGDAVYLYKNFEENIPIGWTDPAESLAAFERIRKAGAQIILPGHDPQVLERFPGGVIG